MLFLIRFKLYRHNSAVVTYRKQGQTAHKSEAIEIKERERDKNRQIANRLSDNSEKEVNKHSDKQPKKFKNVCNITRRQGKEYDIKPKNIKCKRYAKN